MAWAHGVEGRSAWVQMQEAGVSNDDLFGDVWVMRNMDDEGFFFSRTS